MNINRNESARQHWELNYNESGHLMQLVYDMFGIPTATAFTPSPKIRSRLLQIGGENIVCNSTGDVATQEITSDLLNALNKGRTNCRYVH